MRNAVSFAMASSILFLGCGYIDPESQDDVATSKQEERPEMVNQSSENHADEVPDSPSFPFQGQPVSYEMLPLDEVKLGEIETKHLVWDMEESFSAFWSIYATSKAPNINFDQDMVIGIFWGAKANGGYDLVLEHVGLEGEEVFIYYKRLHPNPERDYISMIVYPAALFVIPVEQSKVNFFDRDVIRKD